MAQAEQFLSEAEKKAFDLNHRQRINFNMKRYEDAVVKGKQYFENLDLAREWANQTKWNAIEHLDKNLLKFEENFTAKGGKVIWANNKEEARTEILKILKEENVKMVVKGKSMVTEELEINELLNENQIEPVETDLGEYIQQLDGEKPYHIVTPAMHKSHGDIAKLYHEKFGTDINMSAKDITLFTRDKLRKKFLKAGAGITGANFIIADTGSIALTENEGNIRLSSSFPKVHIAIVGIEKILPSIKDLHLFWPLLATHGTGQDLTVYNTILSGPRSEGEPDGPEKMFVVLLDNGRTNILANPVTRESLYCIRCGACLNACPVYKNIGGHTYGSTYSGPIGSVITPHLQGTEDLKHLSFASSLCGNCTEVCPVKINLHGLLLNNRKEFVDQEYGGSKEMWTWFFWKKGMSSRRLMNFGGAKLKNFGLKKFFKSAWGNRRALPEVAPKSFGAMFKEYKNKK